MVLTEVIAAWVADAERMSAKPALGLVVTAELLSGLCAEQGSESPVVAGLPALPAASGTTSAEDLALIERTEIQGPDRVCVYVGVAPADSPHPVGFDPAMPVVFVPVPPDRVSGWAEMEMYNRLRWYGLGPAEALAGSGQ